MAANLFYLFAVLSIFTALKVVLSNKPVTSVLYLILTFMLFTCQYILLNAQFLAIVNVIVYAGAIMVLFLFVLMLLNLNKETEPQKSKIFKMVAALSAGLLLITMVAAMKTGLNSTQDMLAADSQLRLVKVLGKALFTTYVVPFEVSSILFLSAMVGVVLIGKKEIN